MHVPTYLLALHIYGPLFTTPKKLGEKGQKSGQNFTKKSFTKKIVYTHFLNDMKKVWSFNLAGKTAMTGKHNLHLAPNYCVNDFLRLQMLWVFCNQMFHAS